MGVHGASVPRCAFYLPLGSSSCSKTISMCQSTPSVSRCHNINFKALVPLWGIGKVQIRYFECKIQVKLGQNPHWSGCGSIEYIQPVVAVILCSSFQRIKVKLNVCCTSFWQGLKSCSMQSQISVTAVTSRGWLTPNTTVTPIEQSHNTHCIAICINLNKLVY